MASRVAEKAEKMQYHILGRLAFIDSILGKTKLH
jgi:hypothetical protein